VQITRYLAFNGGFTQVVNAFFLGSPRVHVDSAPHSVANSGLTVSDWHGKSGMVDDDRTTGSIPHPEEMETEPRCDKETFGTWQHWTEEPEGNNRPLTGVEVEGMKAFLKRNAPTTYFEIFAKGDFSPTTLVR
jgi:hypothetical protein